MGVLRLIRKSLAAQPGPGIRALGMRHEIRLVHGLPALVVEDDRPPVRWAALETGDDGSSTAVHSVLASAKMKALRGVA